jgi:two-component system sensor histidine kinase CpxA
MQSREVAVAPTPLEPLVQEALARENAGGAVTVDIPAELQVLADRDLLSRAVSNVVRNALRYAADAGPIMVSATREPVGVTLRVDDAGPGVPAADIDRLGEPFFRPELARTRESGGVGLGLAIVRNSVTACGGEVRFANRSPRGFRVEFRLKAAS